MKYFQQDGRKTAVVNKFQRVRKQDSSPSNCMFLTITQLKFSLKYREQQQLS